MADITIKLFGEFSFIINGKNIIREIGSSKKKTSLLEYFILNRGKAISPYKLYEIFWNDENSKNPVSSLKTLISRLRSSLKEYGLEDAILTKGNGYIWNTSLPCKIDVYDFKDLCTSTGNDLSEENKNKFEKILYLYEQDIDINPVYDAWFAPFSVYYKDIYLQTVMKYLNLLYNAKDYYDVIRVSRISMGVFPFEDEPNIFLMRALRKTGKSAEALAQYESTLDYYYTHLGIQPSQTMRDFYKELLNDGNNPVATIKEIKNQLIATDTDTGAIYCEFSIFKDIYSIQMRNLKRFKIPICLCLVTLTSISRQKNSDLHADVSMKLLKDTLVSTLRKSDTVSRYGAMQYAILLPSADENSGKLALERVRNVFYKHTENLGYALDFRFSLLTDE